MKRKPHPLTSLTLRHILSNRGHSPLAVEIHSDFALFSRSDTAPNFLSHVIPTPSAAKNILQHIFTFPGDEIIIRACEILAPTTFSTKKFNFRGPERKKGCENSQPTWEILNQPKFRISFHLNSPTGATTGRAINTAIRKIKNGDHKVPYMGVSDFLVRFDLPSETPPIPENHTISWMAYDPKQLLFLPDFPVTNGTAFYPETHFRPTA